MKTIVLGNNETRKMFVIIKELLLGKLVGKVYYLLGYFCIINYKYAIISIK